MATSSAKTGNQISCFCREFHGFDAGAAALLDFVVTDRSALAVALLGKREVRNALIAFFYNISRDHLIAALEEHRAHASCGASHLPRIRFLKAYRLSSRGGKDDRITRADKERRVQKVSRGELERNEPAPAHILEALCGNFFNHALCSHHHQREF